MAIFSLGGPGGPADGANYDATGAILSAGDTSVSGALVTGSLTPRHWHASGTAINSTRIQVNPNNNALVASDATHVYVNMDVVLQPVGGTTQINVKILDTQDAASEVFIQYRGGDATQKMRLYQMVSGVQTEIDAADAVPWLTNGSPQSIILSIQCVTPYNIELWVNNWDGNGYVKRQHGTLPNAVAYTELSRWYVCQDGGKGNAINVNCDFANLTMHHDGSIAHSTPYVLGDYIDVVVDTPTTDGALNQWTNDSGTACNTTSTTCSARVADYPTDDTAVPLTSFITVTSAATGHLQQDFNTHNTGKLGGSDTIYGMEVSSLTYLDSDPGAHFVSFGELIDGVNQTVKQTGSFPATHALRWDTCEPASRYNSTTAWTPANASAAKVGCDLGVNGASTKCSVGDVYKFVALKKGPIGKAVLVNEGVTKLRGKKRAGMHFVSMAPPAAAGPPVTPNRRRWVWVS